MAAYAGIAGKSDYCYAEIKPGAEFTQQSYFSQPCEILRKPPQPQGASAAVLAQVHTLFWEGHQTSAREIERLKSMYRFKNEPAVEDFLSDHQSATSLLINALPQLQRWFGHDVPFVLETTREENEQPILYAVAVWRGPVRAAVSALEHFDESWWLDQPSQALPLTFTYELA
jgi:hypothetical protein